MIEVETYKILKSLPNHEEGEIAYITKEDQKYQYTEEKGWQVYKAPSVAEMNLYDLNKSLISQLPDLEDFEEARQLITGYHVNENQSYYMLLFRDLNYYTIFHVNSKDEHPTFENEVLECIKELGTVKSITKCESGGSIECWIQRDEEVTVGYLFGYDGGVIECQ